MMITNPGRRYLASVCVMAFATLLRYSLLPLDAELPFVTYFLGVVVVANWFGVGPSVAFIALSTLAGNYFFLPPFSQFSFNHTALVACGFYLVASGAMVAILTYHHRQVARKSAQLTQANIILSEAQRVARLGSFEYIAQTGETIWSSEEYRIYGFDPSEPSPAYDQMLAKSIHPDDAPLLHATFTQAMQTGSIYELEHRIVLPDGSVRWVHDRAQPYFDNNGKLLRYIGATLDITDRKRTEESLRERETRLSLALDGGRMGMWEWGIQAHRAIWNKREYELLGVPIGDGYPSSKLFFQCIHPEDSPGFNERLSEVLASGNDWNDEYRVVQPDGTIRWLAVSGRLYRDAAGQPLRMVGVNYDVTERKQAQEALQIARDEALRANQAKSRFLAAASHDLRQPLTALSIYANSLTQHVAPEGQPMLSNLRDCVASLSELLSDLLDLSKLDAGVVNVAVQDFVLNEMLMPLISSHLPEAILKDLQLRIRPALRVVRTDPVLLGRIVGNFLANAVHFTERGGILVGCRRRGGKEWLEIWDTGIGIPEDRIPEAFEEFKQLGDDARTRGSGLGLTIAARTAQLLGLEIRASSRLGRGSLFAIELPPGEELPAKQVAEPRVDKRRSLRIALAEDNKMVREALALGLQNAGHRVQTAASGAALLEALASEQPDIVVSDYRLQQGETGFQVIASIRKRYGDDLPALLISGDTDPGLVRSMADRGIVVMHKPVALKTLLAYVEEATSPVAA